MYCHVSASAVARHGGDTNTVARNSNRESFTAAGYFIKRCQVVEYDVDNHNNNNNIKTKKNVIYSQHFTANFGCF